MKEEMKEEMLLNSAEYHGALVACRMFDLLYRCHSVLFTTLPEVVKGPCVLPWVFPPPCATSHGTCSRRGNRCTLCLAHVTQEVFAHTLLLPISAHPEPVPSSVLIARYERRCVRIG